MSTSFDFNQRRFKDLLLYVAQELSDDPTFGETKLNKTLFFADFAAYRKLGKPLTGADYQKNLYGPTARLYTVMRDDLLRFGQLRVERRLVVDHPQDVLKPHDIVPNMGQFSTDEIAIVDEVIAEMREYTNTEASDLSHERSLGWRVLNFGDTIPYESAIINLEPLGDEGLKTLRMLVAA